MTIDVNVLRERLRQFADQAAGQAAVNHEMGNYGEAQFQSGRQAAFVTALNQLERAENQAGARPGPDADLATLHNAAAHGVSEGFYEREEVDGAYKRVEAELARLRDEAARLGVIGYGQGVDLGAVERLEEFARQAGGAVDMASGTVYSDADGGL